MDNLEILAFLKALIGILLYILGVESICNPAPCDVLEVCRRTCNLLTLQALFICNLFPITLPISEDIKGIPTEASNPRNPPFCICLLVK